MKRMISIITMAAVLLATTGCASIISGGSQDISFNSDPTGASLTVYDWNNLVVFESRTPANVTLDRGAGFFEGARYTVEVASEGYETATVRITPKMNGWYIGGNFLIGGLIGWLIIDPISGAMWNLSPDQINTNLASEVGLQEVEDGTFTIVLKEQIPEELWVSLNAVPVVDSLMGM
jgi:hypothetical protein